MIARRTVDLSAYPDMVVIYLGMRAQSPKGLVTLIQFRSKIQNAMIAKLDGLLLHEPVLYSLFPLHVGMRQYWRDFASLEKWTRALPHKEWWAGFLRDPSGVGFWHETYFARGGFEAIYDGLDRPVGFLQFAKETPAEGGMFSARRRLQLPEQPE
jgi:hypothetical protein